MFGKLEAAELEEVLNKEIMGRLGCHANGTTYVVPISYAYDGKYLYGRSLEGMKIDFMRINPKICFQVDLMQNAANWKSVILWGEFEELSDPEMRNKALQKLTERKLPIVSSDTMHLTTYWPFPEQNIADIKGIVFRILVTQKTGRYESGQAVGSFTEYS